MYVGVNWTYVVFIHLIFKQLYKVDIIILIFQMKKLKLR